jgi:arsenite methyltransferase
VNRAAAASGKMCAVLRSSVGRQGNYGVDTPIVPAVQSFIAIMLFQIGIGQVSGPERDPQGWWAIGSGSILLTIALTYLHASRRGKFVAWSRALADLKLKGDEQVLDLGCGRGAVATLAAARVPRGKVTGIDSWAQKSRIGGNRKGDPEVVIARRNAELEGVKVDFQTGDMTKLPLPGNQYDLVVSNLGVGAITKSAERESAVDEAVRVLKPGGRIAIADTNFTGHVAKRLADLGMLDVKTSSMGWEAWYGGPWRPTKLVCARKPRK